MKDFPSALAELLDCDTSNRTKRCLTMVAVSAVRFEEVEEDFGEIAEVLDPEAGMPLFHKLTCPE